MCQDLTSCLFLTERNDCTDMPLRAPWPTFTAAVPGTLDLRATFPEHGLCFLPQQLGDCHSCPTVTSVPPMLHWTPELSPLSDSEVAASVGPCTLGPSFPEPHGGRLNLELRDSLCCEQLGKSTLSAKRLDLPEGWHSACPSQLAPQAPSMPRGCAGSGSARQEPASASVPSQQASCSPMSVS